MQRIQLREKPHESASRVGLIVRSNLRSTKRFGDGHGAVKIIGIGGAEARNLALRLRPSRSSANVCTRYLQCLRWHDREKGELEDQKMA
jgi:hypothetical protein